MADQKYKLEIIVDGKTGIATVNQLGQAVEHAGKTSRSAFSGLDANLGSIENKIGGVTRRLTSMQSVLLGLASGYGLKMLAGHAVDTGDAFEQMEIKLDALTYGRGKQTLMEINDWAKEMPVNTRKAVDAFTMMSAMGLAPTIAKMETLVDVASVMGEEAMPVVARALGQMQTLGKLSAEELNQLAEAGVNARKYLAAAFGGKTVEQIQATGIAIEQVVDAIWKGLDRDFGGSAKAAMSTWRGLKTIFASNVVELERIAMQAGILDEMKTQLKSINDIVGSWIKDNESLIRQKIPEYIEDIKTQAVALYDWAAQNKDMLEYGLVGKLLLGTQGMVALGAVGHVLDQFRATMPQTPEAKTERDLGVTRSNIQMGEAVIRMASNKETPWWQRPPQETIDKWTERLPALRRELRLLEQTLAAEEDTAANFWKQAERLGVMGGPAGGNANTRTAPPKLPAAAPVGKTKAGPSGIFSWAEFGEDVNRAWIEANSAPTLDYLNSLRGQVAEALQDLPELQNLPAGLEDALNALPGYVQEAGEKAQAEYDRSFGKAMIDATRQTAYNMQTVMGDVFFDGMRGELKDFADYWDAFCSSLERTLADTAARMASQELFGYDKSQAEGGGRDWGWVGKAASAVGSYFKSSGGSEAAGGAWDWIKGAASSVGSWLGFAEGTASVPYTMPAIVHAKERIVPASANQDWGAALQFLVGGQVAQTGVDAEIAAALGQIQVNTADTAAGVKGLDLSLGLSMDTMSTAIRVALTGMAGLGTLALTGSPVLGIKAAQLAWGKSEYTADLLADRLGGGFPLLGPGGIGRLIYAGAGYDPDVYRGETPPGYPGEGTDPWGLFDIQGSRQEGGEIDVGGLYVMHPNEVVYNGPQQRALVNRMDRIEAAVAARPAVSPVFQFVNNGVVTTQDADAWFAERIQQYEDQFSAASQDRIQAVATAGVSL